MKVQSTPKAVIHLRSNSQTSTEIQTSPSLSETLPKQNQSLAYSLQWKALTTVEMTHHTGPLPVDQQGIKLLL